MSIDQLVSDTQAVIKRLPSGPLVSAADMAAFFRNDFLPLFENLVEEVHAQDDAIYAIVNDMEDVLHTENAVLFTAVIEGAAELVAALEQRLAADDQTTRTAIAEWRAAADRAKAVIEDILVPDEDPDDAEDSDDDEGTDATTPTP